MSQEPTKDMAFGLEENASGDEANKETVEENTTEQEHTDADATVPDLTESLQEELLAAEDDEDSADENFNFIDGKSLKPKRQHIQWTNPTTERKLLLFGLHRKLRPWENEKIAKSINPKASEKSIAVHISKMRKSCHAALKTARICDTEEGRTFARPTEDAERAQDDAAGQSPTTWDARSDRDLLLYGLERHAVSAREHGRIARRLPNRPTRQAINERLDALIAESRELLAEHGLEEGVPAENPSSKKGKGKKRGAEGDVGGDEKRRREGEGEDEGEGEGEGEGGTGVC